MKAFILWIKRRREARRVWRHYLQTDGRALDGIIGLVQDHPEFFGNPILGSSCTQAAYRKLYDLVYNQPHIK